MNERRLDPEFRCGFVAVVGKPNVGKSTLINSLVGQKIAPVSPKPQTTRHRQLGILTSDEYQIIFIDTPGLHIPRHKLGEFLNQEAEASCEGVDVILWLVDISSPPDEEDRKVADFLHSLKPLPATIMALNKVDLISTETLEKMKLIFAKLFPEARLIPLSATRGDGREELLQAIVSLLPFRPPEFPEDQLTDLYERDIAADLIREAVLHHVHQEVPHAVAVRIDEYKERGEIGAYVAATIFVEKESQKAIVIGEGGQMIKKIGISARREIEAMSGRKIYLDLRVKVLKNWRNNPVYLKRLGYKLTGRK
ncbi:MAG: GTPase Era [Candidatus Aminicenantes bacterium]|nr:GTPase Era [Candidatus Aminicenantes bacterium]